MNASELKTFLQKEIPLASFMEVDVSLASKEKVVLTAPLGPSHNHMDTAFGGSIGAVLILSCYAWLFHHLISQGFECHVLIKEGHTDYHHPIKEELKAICLSPVTSDLEKFITTFTRRGLAKIELSSFLETNDGKGATFHGTFVAQRS
jgi:thioesterase domain-containing protein